jgi:hypothetical protein
VGELNEGKETMGGGCGMGRGRAPGARGPRLDRARPGRVGLGRAGLGRTAGQNPMARTTTDRNTIRETKSEMRLSNKRD